MFLLIHLQFVIMPIKPPTAVYVEVTGDTVQKDIDNVLFHTDKRVKKAFRTTSKDYTNTGYDRGLKRSMHSMIGIRSIKKQI